MDNSEASKQLLELPKRIDQPYRDRIKSLIKALRSGNYIQGKGQNRIENQYCCLGVGCDIFHKETGRGEWVEKQGYDGVDYFKIEIRETGYVLPKEVKAWYGFESDNPVVIIPPKYRHEVLEMIEGDSAQLNLGTLNDSFFNFDQIADVLEYNFLNEE